MTCGQYTRFYGACKVTPWYWAIIGVCAERSPVWGVVGGFGGLIEPEMLGEQGRVAAGWVAVTARRRESPQRNAEHPLHTGKAGTARCTGRA